MKNIFLLAVLLPLTILAQEKHLHHEAHIHGQAKLAIAFDSNSGKIEYESAADGIIGFEHKPTSEKDKKKIEEVTKIFETQISEMIKFDPSLKCQFTKDRVGLFFKQQAKGSGQHSDWIATYTVVCAKPLQNTELQIDFTRFDHIEDIDITLLVGNIQKSAEYKKKPLKIEIK